MKTGNAALIIAGGILLLWVVTSGRTKNLASAWATLFQTPSGSGGASGFLQNIQQGIQGAGSGSGGSGGGFGTDTPPSGTPSDGGGDVSPNIPPAATQASSFETAAQAWSNLQAGYGKNSDILNHGSVLTEGGYPL